MCSVVFGFLGFWGFEFGVWSLSHSEWSCPVVEFGELGLKAVSCKVLWLFFLVSSSHKMGMVTFILGRSRVLRQTGIRIIGITLIIQGASIVTGS